jgi:hypothetical protein
MSSTPDHEFEELEDDSRIPPRPEEEVADADRDNDGRYIANDGEDSAEKHWNRSRPSDS